MYYCGFIHCSFIVHSLSNCCFNLYPYLFQYLLIVYSVFFRFSFIIHFIIRLLCIRGSFPFCSLCLPIVPHLLPIYSLFTIYLSIINSLFIAYLFPLYLFAHCAGYVSIPASINDPLPEEVNLFCKWNTGPRAYHSSVFFEDRLYVMAGNKY
jgi:hypothetical protein